MDEREAEELLTALQETGPTPTDVRARVWAAVEAADESAVTADAHADRLLVVVATEQDGDPVARRRVAAVAAAAVVLIALVAAAILWPSASPEDLATEGPAVTTTTTSLPRLDDPLLACERFRAAGIDHAVLRSPPAVAPATATIERVEAAVAILIADLRAAPFVEPALYGAGDEALLERVEDLLRQARLQSSQGEPADALDTLRAASGLVQRLQEPVQDGVTPCLAEG